MNDTIYGYAPFACCDTWTLCACASVCARVCTYMHLKTAVVVNVPCHLVVVCTHAVGHNVLSLMFVQHTVIAGASGLVCSGAYPESCQW